MSVSLDFMMDDLHCDLYLLDVFLLISVLVTKMNSISFKLSNFIGLICDEEAGCDAIRL